MLKAIKNLILRDVSNRNESSNGAIALRICSLILITYLALFTTILACTSQTKLCMINLLFIVIYVWLFWLTFCDMTKGALLWFDLSTIGLVCFNVMYIGWNSGIQHFLFVLILFNLIFIYMSYKVQFAVTIVLCMIRLCLYYLCKFYPTRVNMSASVEQCIQIMTTIYVFLLLYICSVMLCRDSQNMERKLIEYNNELEELANTDNLTKLWNRHYLMHYIGEQIKNPCEFVSIAIGDIDFFKKINDNYGHECGDEVLRKLAKVFTESMKGKGVVARWGGEEFIFIYENANGDEAKQKLAELQDAVKKTEVIFEEQKVKVTMTFGLTEFDYSKSLDENIGIADQRLYQGKKAGRDRIIY